ncbi:MAG TPA: hypothetical protein VGE02_09515 [Gemmatimonadales bacterium]
MPQVPFDTLPDSSRVWVFASTRALSDSDAARLLGEVDRFLERWHAHGTPLSSGRDWRDGHFLTIAVDQSTAGASGCSIDGLHRALHALESALETSLLGGGTLYFRDADGGVQGVSRAAFAGLAREGRVAGDTVVFDTAVDTLGEWRERFEHPARLGWHSRWLPEAARRP